MTTTSSAPPAPPRSTAGESSRRTLRFTSIEQALAEARRLVGAEQAGSLRRTGNWTLGQALGHLAAWAGYCFDGYPIRTPRVIGWLLRLRRHRFLHAAMPAGVHIPGVKGGTVATEELSTDEGYARFRRSFERLRDEGPMDRHPFLGRMSHDDWIALNLRHAELHLSFFVAE